MATLPHDLLSVSDWLSLCEDSRPGLPVLSRIFPKVRCCVVYSRGIAASRNQFYQMYLECQAVLDGLPRSVCLEYTIHHHTVPVVIIK